MKRQITTTMILLLLCSMVVLSGCGDEKQAEISTKIVDFKIKTVDGDILTPADFRGKVLMIDYWATWCAPCRKEFKHFDKLLDTYGDEFVIIAVSADEDRPTLDNFLEESPLRYIIGLQFESEFPSWHEVLTLPEAFIIDRTGVLRANLKGGHKFEDFDKEIKPLIEESYEPAETE